MTPYPLLAGCLLLALLPAGLAAQAQAAGQRGPRPAVGAEVGYSRSDLGGPDAQRVRSRQGALTGVFLVAPLAGPLSLRPEILFALKGGRAQSSVVGGGTVELDIELAYIEMPVLMKVGAPRGRFRPMVFGGPAPALQIGCDLQVVDPATPARAACDQTGLPPFRQFDVGLVAVEGSRCAGRSRPSPSRPAIPQGFARCWSRSTSRTARSAWSSPSPSDRSPAIWTRASRVEAAARIWAAKGACPSGMPLRQSSDCGDSRRPFPKASGGVSSEQVPPADLELPRLAEPAPDRAVEVEERAARRRILEVVGVRHVEHLEDRLECALAAEVERPRQPDVPREERVVPADRVALQDVPVGADALRRRGRAQCPWAGCSAPQVSEAGCAEYALNRLLR